MSPRRGCGDRPEVTRSPLAPAVATSRPTQGAPPPAQSSLCPLLTSTTRGETSHPEAHRPASRCTPRQVHPTSVPACVLNPGPHAAPAGHPLPTPRPNLLVRVCFFGHFPVHLDACPAAGSFAPFIFLSVRPPSSHLRRSPDLVGEGERQEMKGAPQKAEGEAGRQEREVRFGEGVQRQAAGGVSAAAPRARQEGLRGLGCGPRGRDLGRGRRWGRGGEKQARRGAAGTAERRRRRGPAGGGGSVQGRPRGPGQSRFRGAVGSRGRCAWEVVQGAPSEPHLSTPPIYSILDSHRRQQEEEVGRKR